MLPTIITKSKIEIKLNNLSPFGLLPNGDFLEFKKGREGETLLPSFHILFQKFIQ